MEAKYSSTFFGLAWSSCTSHRAGGGGAARGWLSADRSLKREEACSACLVWLLSRAVVPGAATRVSAGAREPAQSAKLLTVLDGADGR